MGYDFRQSSHALRREGQSELENATRLISTAPYTSTTMSSPIAFPSSEADDVPMQDAGVENTPSNVPARLPLFNPSSPSVTGTPRQGGRQNVASSTPLRGAVARRALGISPRPAVLRNGE